MPYLTRHIDRAIVQTQYDLRGFYHPLLGRMERGYDAKSFDATVGNFIGFAAGATLDEANDNDPNRVHYLSSFSYEEYRAMCKRLEAACELSEKEAIQLIVEDFVRLRSEIEAKIAAGETERSPYLMPLDKSNRQGIAILALAEVFEVNIESVATAA